MTKMTKKTAFSIAINALDALNTDETKTAIEVIKNEIERIDRASAKAKTVVSKAAKEHANFRETVLNYINEKNTPMRASDVALALNVSIQKATAALTALVEAGALARVDGEKRTILFKVATAK